MNNRVVITGIGVAAPNGVGITNFLEAIKCGRSGIKFIKELEELNFSCCIGGIPEVPDEMKEKYFTPLQLRNFNSSGILYGCIAGIDAWTDAGFKINNTDEPDYSSGLIFGAGTSGVDKMRQSFYMIDDKQVRRLGSNAVQQTMVSGVSAYLSGMLGLGNQVTTNSSACSTGTEAVLMGYERIKSGKAERMLTGSTNDSGPYVWAGFDAMKVITFRFNHSPEKGSRPMSRTASGFVPVRLAHSLESLESALERGAKIMRKFGRGGKKETGRTARVQRCINEALNNSGIKPDEIDAIDGHLTATTKDSAEIENWAYALQRNGKDFPFINSLKSMTGHCLSASGAIECAAAVFELKEQFLYPSINCEDVHPEIEKIIDINKIPMKVFKPEKLNIIAKASFGFGDVNACIILKKYN
jgi:3-oxoacyl-(acyl-carrier-protein) synthase